MDVFFTFKDDFFVWNSDKATENSRKHGISFELACEAFYDPYSVFVSASSESEPREALIGHTFTGKLLFVVSVQREGNLLRLISARPVEPHERRLYENGE